MKPRRLTNIGADIRRCQARLDALEGDGGA